MSSHGEIKKRKEPFYQDVDGFRLPGIFSPEAFRSIKHYQPRDDDLFIATYPKCGTTWVQHIVAAIFKAGQPFDSALEFFTDSPFLELAGAEAIKAMRRPGAIKVHLPFHLTPYSPKAKYIFVARNPKDCCVSFYHHTKNLKTFKFTDGTFDDFFELFIEGEVEFGDYFDTLLSWYEHRNDPNVLFITYEDLKRDAKKNILRIAEFIGEEYKKELESNEEKLMDIVLHTSFQSMKKTLSRHMDEFMSMPKGNIINDPKVPDAVKAVFSHPDVKQLQENESANFVRKGEIGDWINYFTPQQNARLEKKFRDRTRGTDIPNLWKDYM